VITPNDAVVVAGWCEQGRSAVRAYHGRVRDLHVIDAVRPDDLPADVPFTPLGPAATEVLTRADVVLRCPPLHPRHLDTALAALPTARHPRRTSATQELLERRGPERVVGVTGTKGKSSTAALVTHVIGRDSPVLMAGNCGLSPLDVVDAAVDWIVLELANFQTMDLTIAPRHVVLRPITEDHLDWHADVAEYVAAKRRLVQMQDQDGVTVYDTADPVGTEVADSGPGRALGAPGPDLFVDAGRRLHLRGQVVTTLAPDIHTGRHGVSNAVAAAQLLDALGVAPEAIASGLESFPGLRHRLERLPPIGGVRVVNDSHSTAVPSTVAALDAVEGPHVLLLGGDAKDADLRPLATAVSAAQPVACVTFGEDGALFGDALAACGVRVERLPQDASMAETLAVALRHAHKGNCVLLSPGGASGRQFADAAARGDAFRAAARERR
jgi:UDP-N-acetylmuramoylalanine--D-glutamate ligase